MAMTEPLNNGRFGNFGGMFVPETLIPACQELEKAFREAWGSEDFRNELAHYSRIMWQTISITECEDIKMSLATKYFSKEKI